VSCLAGLTHTTIDRVDVEYIPILARRSIHTVFNYDFSDE
jgi:hypothetical protein